MRRQSTDLDDVSAAADPAVHQHGHALAHCGHNAGQRVQAGGGVVQLAPAMIADYDAVCTGVHAHVSVLWAEHTLGKIQLSALVARSILHVTDLFF